MLLVGEKAIAAVVLLASSIYGDPPDLDPGHAARRPDLCSI